jgi:hypothetical protein
MDSKYYTPIIDEFHVGFECEKAHGVGDTVIDDIMNPLIDDSTTWDKIIVQPSLWGGNAMWLLIMKNINTFRVKYLDKEDIESLGFIEGKDEGNVNCYIKDIYRLYCWFSGVVSINKYSIDNQIFRGNIKNKSELKILLKQLGIDE